MTYKQVIRRIGWNDDIRARRSCWEPRIYVDIQRNFTPDGRGLTRHLPTLNEYDGDGTLSDPFIPTAEDLTATDWEAIDREDFYHLVHGNDAPPLQNPDPNVRCREIRIGPGVLTVGYWVPSLSGLRSVPLLGRLIRVFARKPRDAGGED